MMNHRSPLWLLGIVIGGILAIVLQGYELSLPWGPRLHHVWLGLAFLVFGGYVKNLFLIGLGVAFTAGDIVQHVKPDGSTASFW